MRAIVLFGFLLLAVVSGEYATVQKNYLSEVGAPLAKRIKEYEDALFASPDAESEGNRIVGGVIAPVNAHPYLAGLVISLTSWPWTAACGSSLLSSNKLVTAAHCWFDGTNRAWQFEVVLGSQFLFHGGRRIRTSNVIMHPQWFPQWLWNDVAVITLPENVQFTNSIRPAALPTANDLFNTFVGEVAMASGYGRTSDAQVGVSTNTLVSHVSLRVISVLECQWSYGTTFVQPSTLCTSGAGGVGICGGDSGGPLVVNRNGNPVLIGISSFAADGACQQGHPSGFARVTSFINFISQHM